MRANIYSASFSENIEINKQTTLDRLIEVVSQVTNVPVVEIQNKSRKREIVESRHLYCWIATKLLGYTVTSVGKSIKKDHSSVIHGRNTIDDLSTYDKRFAKMINDIKQKLK